MNGLLVEFTRWIWHKTSVPVFLERFILPLFAAGVVLLAATNPMGFDTTQRITGAVTLILAAYFVGHTVYKSSSKNLTTSTPSATKEPKGFEIASTPPVVGEGAEVSLATVYVQVSVLNHGEPSIIKKWSGFVRLPDGTMLEGPFVRQP